MSRGRESRTPAAPREMLIEGTGPPARVVKAVAPPASGSSEFCGEIFVERQRAWGRRRGSAAAQARAPQAECPPAGVVAG